jgi:transposase
MQDNVPCHKAKKVMDFLREQNVETLNWPPHSPDLNHIENIWKIIGERALKTNPRNQEGLWSLLKVEWNKITPPFCRSLISSCSRRCQAVIDAKGMFTKY